ncbi:MAG: porin family protein, partial [Tunicatimonas sp.]
FIKILLIMKKLFALALSVLFWIPVIAQDLRVGVRGGVNFANQRVEVMGLYNPLSRAGWQFGTVVDLAINEVVSVQPALLLSSKGVRYESGIVGVDYDVRFQPLYLHLPVPIIASAETAGIKLLGGIGPYASVGIGGKIVAEGSIDAIGFNIEGDESIEWGSERGDHYRTVDAGIQFLVGIEPIENFQLLVSYEQGLTNISPTHDNDALIRNRVFNFTLTTFLTR